MLVHKYRYIRAGPVILSFAFNKHMKFACVLLISNSDIPITPPIRFLCFF